MGLIQSTALALCRLVSGALSVYDEYDVAVFANSTEIILRNIPPSHSGRMNTLSWCLNVFGEIPDSIIGAENMLGYRWFMEYIIHVQIIVILNL